MSKPLTIAIETCFLFDQYSRRGIGRYAKEIYTRLLSERELCGRPLHILWLGYNDLHQNLFELFEEKVPENLPEIEFISLREAKLSSPLTNLRQYYSQIRPMVRKHKPDLYFATYFERGIPSDLVPAVVTAHDAIPLKTGKFNSKGFVLNRLKGLYYRHMWDKQKRAELILTNSNVSAKELVEFGGLPSEKIEPIYLGISDIFGRAESELGNWTRNLPFEPELTDYLLYDGGFEPTKQIPQLIKQFKEVSTRLPELKLVVTGRDFEPGTNILEAKHNTDKAHQLVNLTNQLNIVDKIVPVGLVSEATLVGLLQHAKAYINFSEFEGFGFGPLQAMKAGTPAIIGDNECFREVSAGGALMVDPKTLDANTERILELINNQDTRQSYIKKGLNHAENFNWYNTWQSTKALLEHLCASFT